MSKRKAANICILVVLLFVGVLIIVPFVSILIHSFDNFYPGDTENLSKIFYLPYPISANQYYKAILLNRETLHYFWNTMAITIPTLLLATCIALPSGYALAKFKFPCKRLIFFTYVLLMLMPVQVGIVGTYIFFDKIQLLNSFTGVILSCAFSPFGSFLIYQFIKIIPDNTLESARLDGAGELLIFLKIIVPQAKAGITSMVVLILIDIWNMVEIPMLLLKGEALLPMSVMLRYMDINHSDIIFAAIVVFTIPLLLVFAFCRDSLSEGITRSVPTKK